MNGKKLRSPGARHLILGLYVFKSKFFQYPYLPVVNGLQMQIGTSSS